LIHLTPAELPHGADHALDGPVSVRDYRLLEAALARPQASVAGQDAYPTLDHKAAAPLHSQARNHPLVDGNKRLALARGFHRRVAWVRVDQLKGAPGQQGCDLSMATFVRVEEHLSGEEA